MYTFANFRITFTITTALEHQIQSLMLSYFIIVPNPALYPLLLPSNLVQGYNVADRYLTSIRLPFLPCPPQILVPRKFWVPHLSSFLLFSAQFFVTLWLPAASLISPKLPLFHDRLRERFSPVLSHTKFLFLWRFSTFYGSSTLWCWIAFSPAFLHVT